MATAQGNSGRGFPFQGIARDANGNILKNESLELKVGLLEMNASSSDYEETHTITTDPYGVFSLVIGTGTQFSVANGISEFRDLNFRVGQYWVKVELKEGSSWIELTTQKLLSVPYAENTFIMPLGTIMPYGGTLESAQDLERDGWMVCDGRTLSKDEYSELFAALGSSWGDEGADFRLPDLRGVFLRGLDQRTIDSKDPDGNDRLSLYSGGNSGRNVGSYQTDTLASHLHNVVSYLNNTGNPDGALDSYGGGVQNRRYWRGTTTRQTAGFGGNETRAKNVYVIYLIRVK